MAAPTLSLKDSVRPVMGIVKSPSPNALIAPLIPVLSLPKTSCGAHRARVIRRAGTRGGRRHRRVSAEVDVLERDRRPGLVPAGARGLGAQDLKVLRFQLRDAVRCGVATKISGEDNFLDTDSPAVGW